MSQSSQSGRIVSLVAVINGQVWVLNAGGTIWGFAINATGGTLNTTGVVRSAVNNQKLWFADGTHSLYYDPSDNAVHSWVASAGSLPSNSGNFPRLICTYRGRTVQSGISTDGQNWFMSLVNDPTNWDYFPTSPSATQAVAGNASDLGLIGDVVTALVPYTDDVLIFGGDHTIWQMTGDPADGGRIDLISDITGFAWGNAWCKAPDGTLYFVSNKMGIYYFIPGQGPPVRMSQQIEQLLVGIDTGSNVLRMLWDDRWQGFHLFVSPVDAPGASTHFFWESRTGAWWTDVFTSNNMNPVCCTIFDGNTPGDRHPLIGSWTGQVRSISPTATDDDGTAISSSVVLGPILSQDLDVFLLKDLQAVLASASGSVSFAVYVGATAESALASTPVATGTWSAGRNLNTPIRRADHALWLKLTSTSQWAMEQIRGRIAGQGKVRRRSY